MQLSPAINENNDDNYGEERGRLQQLVHQLQLRVDDDPNSLLQQYQHASMTEYHEFKVKFDHNYGSRISAHAKFSAMVHQIRTNGPRIEGITSLGFCFSTTTKPSNSIQESYVLCTLPYLPPSLREVDLTKTYVTGKLLRTFFQNGPCLGKLTFNSETKIGTSFYNKHTHKWYLNSAMESANNLKELIIDDLFFVSFSVNNEGVVAMSDLDDDTELDSKIFMFHKYSSKVLSYYAIGGKKTSTDAIPQKGVDEMYWNAPTTMRWFQIQFNHGKYRDLTTGMSRN